MQFIIQMDYLPSTSVVDFLLPMAAISFSSLQILIYKFNALRMNGLPSNLVVCCKTFYFNSLNKLYHLII